ncbi:MAG: HlyD family efflux transporter periplasmic adaptor subunit [Rhodomicrobium sp.]
MSMRRIRPTSLMLLFGVLTFGTGVVGAMGLLSFGVWPAYSEQPAALEPAWAAAAPGRVEPKGRELHVRASAPGAIKEVLVQLNDRVKAGDLLIRLDDEELKAKLAASKAEAAVRAAERDDKEVKGAAHDRRKAEDSLYSAERSAFDARIDLDRLISLARANEVEASEVDKARSAVAAAEIKVEHERANLKHVLTKSMPALTREEAALAAARADVAVVSTALERTHIRSPIDATVLELHAKLGEMANPAAETPLLALGDTTHLQVRAEVQERDVRKIYPGQAAIVKSDAFPDRAFDARVSVMARALGEPQLLTRGQRKPTDVDVLEVILDLDDGVPLLPGMRTDVLFKEAEGQKTPVAKTE